METDGAKLLATIKPKSKGKRPPIAGSLPHDKLLIPLALNPPFYFSCNDAFGGDADAARALRTARRRQVQNQETAAG